MDAGLALVLLPLWLALLGLSALGPTCFLAALNVRFKDARQVVPAARQVLFVLSSVAYSSASLDGPTQHAYAINPVVGVLEFGRFVLVEGQGSARPW